MNATPTQTAGYRDEWDSSWSSLENGMVQLYTKGPLRNIHQFWQRCYFEDLWNCMGPEASRAKYIELGAGRGTTSMYLASAGCEVTMLDLSSAGFQVAAANFQREGLRPPTFVHADARNTKLDDESFDCVFNIGLLEHFENPQEVLAETVRLLKPGGLNFAVIMPERPASIRFLSLGLLRPWALMRELVPSAAREQVRKMRGHDTGPLCRQRPVLRTTYSRADYLAMLKGMAVTDTACVPYNPYHPIYKTAELEAALTIPLFNAHHKVKKAFSSFPLLKTWPSLASCDLLTFRKLY